MEVTRQICGEGKKGTGRWEEGREEMNEFKIVLKDRFECSPIYTQKDILPGVQSLRIKFLFCFQGYSVFLHSS